MMTMRSRRFSINECPRSSTNSLSRTATRGSVISKGSSSFWHDNLRKTSRTPRTASCPRMLASPTATPTRRKTRSRTCWWTCLPNWSKWCCNSSSRSTRTSSRRKRISVKLSLRKTTSRQRMCSTSMTAKPSMNWPSSSGNTRKRRPRWWTSLTRSSRPS